jgi:hypothetical protein
MQRNHSCFDTIFGFQKLEKRRFSNDYILAQEVSGIPSWALDSVAGHIEKRYDEATNKIV